MTNMLRPQGRHYSPLLPALILFVLFTCCGELVSAQEHFSPLRRIDFPDDPLTITQTVNPKQPFSIAGDHGAAFGLQNGDCELWAFPVKILQGLHVFARVDDYQVPIDMNAQATTIQVAPDHTTIVFSHAAIVIKQTMFAPRASTGGNASVIVLFEIHSSRPATITFRFEPALAPEWPAPNFGRPSASWVKIGDGGGFLLETPNPQLSALVAIPRTASQTLAPVQEPPYPFPLEMVLRYNPVLDKDLVFPLLAAVAYNRLPEVKPEETAKNLTKELLTLNGQVAEIYAKTRDYYSHFFDDKLTIDSPDPVFNRAIRWAELAIDQSQVSLKGETGLVAGWYWSGAFARPGYGWFFGRDMLWTIYALNSYGDFALTRKALEFLIRRQRADGKIMHEFSQTSDQVDWLKLPYPYASADSTPLFVMAMDDYVRSSGDVAFLRAHADSVKRAYAFTRSHDTDHDGIYDNSEGTGWVESWKPRMPDQELYLAALDQQSAEAMAELTKLLNEDQLSQQALATASQIRERLNAYRLPDGFYAFSKSKDGSYDPAPTIFPSVAWWNGRLALPNADPMLSRWASHEFSTDWGLRSLSELSTLYDPLSYHQGTVWPLFTGWVAMAEYRAGRPLAGYQQLMSSVNLTWTQDAGGIPELLSGKFFEPLGRSSSRQMWSSAMVISDAVRGMLGMEADTLRHDLKVSPALPAAWDWVSVKNVPFGNKRINVTIRRVKGELVIEETAETPHVLCLSTAILNGQECKQAAELKHSTKIPLPPVEIGFNAKPPERGAETRQMKILEEQYSRNSLTLQVEAPAGTIQQAMVKFNTAKKQAHFTVSGATLKVNELRIVFPAGEGYQKQTVKIQW